MKSILSIASLLFAVFAGLIIAGWPSAVEPMQHAQVLPDDLDSYLMDSESVFDDIVAGAEKKIIWVDSTKQKTPLSIVYLHGFSATRQETAPLSDSLARRWGANLYYARLAGHGRGDDAMGEPTVDDWFADTAEAIEIGRRIGERVVVIGTSTGGTLATWLAAQDEHEESLAGVVLISPNYWPRATGVGLLLWPYGALIGKAVQGEYVEWEPQNEGHGTYWTNRYPVSAAVEMMRLVSYVNDIDLNTVDVPVLVIYSPNDGVVDPTYITAAYDEFGASSKQIIPVEQAESHNNHVLAGEILSPGDTGRLIQYIDTFFKDLQPAM